MLDFWYDISFANPTFFWLLLIIPLLIIWYILRLKKHQGSVKLSTNENLTSTFLAKSRHSIFLLRIIGIAALITAIARPQTSSSWQDVSTEGIDIILSIDVSGSMLAEDFKPNRLEACKNIAMEFISNRPNDRMGLVVFAGESFTQCPLTTDHDVLINLFSSIQNGMIEDGTAIGMGLATAVSRLKDSEAKSKVVILLTDGINNSGSIPPVTAAEIAREFGVRVYTIGVGTTGTAPTPYVDQFGRKQYQDVPVRIDEETMTQIAEMADGKYFRAKSNKELEEIYKEIDQMEKSKINVTDYRKKSEKFLPFALLAACALLIEFLLTKTLYKSIV